MPLTFTCIDKNGSRSINAEIHSLVIAGWTGRDVAALEHHIAELAALGVKRPSRIPCYYRVAADRLTTAEQVDCLGAASSGEVEAVMIALPDGLWVGLGSDHTDREVEAYSVAVSKQMCPKPLAPVLWRFDEVAPHFDSLISRSFILEDGQRKLYQEGPLAKMRPPADLMAGLDSGRLGPGCAMFCGTHGAIGGVRPAARFEMELEDPVLGRRIQHGYTVETLPIVS